MRQNDSKVREAVIDIQVEEQEGWKNTEQSEIRQRRWSENRKQVRNTIRKSDDAHQSDYLTLCRAEFDTVSSNQQPAQAGGAT